MRVPCAGSIRSMRRLMRCDRRSWNSLITTKSTSPRPMLFRRIQLNEFIGRGAHVEQKRDRYVALRALAPPINLLHGRRAGAPIDEVHDDAVQIEIFTVVTPGHLAKQLRNEMFEA